MRVPFTLLWISMFFIVKFWTLLWILFFNWFFKSRILSMEIEPVKNSMPFKKIAVKRVFSFSLSQSKAYSRVNKPKLLSSQTISNARRSFFNRPMPSLLELGVIKSFVGLSFSLQFLSHIWKVCILDIFCYHRSLFAGLYHVFLRWTNDWMDKNFALFF